MIDRDHGLSLVRQAKALNISRDSAYYKPRPVSPEDLAIMRMIDELHLDSPFAGSRMMRDFLATRLLIMADGGGSNGSRVRLWKLELQRLADELGISIEVHHLPLGTSKWNTIEHRLFSFITQNWRAKPLVSYRVIVDLIGATTTTGLKVLCELDENKYPKGVVVTDAEMAGLNIKRADFHGEWNYTIAPSSQQCEAIVA